MHRDPPITAEVRTTLPRPFEKRSHGDVAPAHLIGESGVTDLPRSMDQCPLSATDDNAMMSIPPFGVGIPVASLFHHRSLYTWLIITVNVDFKPTGNAKLREAPGRVIGAPRSLWTILFGDRLFERKWRRNQIWIGSMDRLKVEYHPKRWSVLRLRGTMAHRSPPKKSSGATAPGPVEPGVPGMPTSIAEPVSRRGPAVRNPVRTLPENAN